MTHAIILLVSTAMMLAGTLALWGSSCAAVDMLSRSWQGATELTGQIARTRMSRVGGEMGDQGTNVRLVLENSGQTPLADFSRWDVIVQYYGERVEGTRPYFIKHLAFSEGAPGDDEWQVEGIYVDAETSKPEVFEPGVLNPGEEVKIHMRLNPQVGTGTANWAIIGASNGVTAPVIFTRLIAWDDFESGDLSGGIGWLDSWSTVGSMTVTDEDSPYAGIYHMEVDKGGEAERPADLSGYSSPRLQFWAKVTGLTAVNQKKAYADVFDGSDWHIVRTWDNNDPQGVYQFEDIDLSPYMSSDFWLRFRVDAGTTGTWALYVDELEIMR